MAERGLTLLIEPLNPRHVPGFFLNNQAQAHAVCSEVGEPNLKVQLDRVGHIQIAGAPDRHEPDDGELNYRYLFSLIDRLGYAGWIGCEYRRAGRTEDGLSWIERLTA
jgi:2-dehydrotetronate isomerase